MTSQVTDVLEAVRSFTAKGYDREYRVKDGNLGDLVDLELGSPLDPCIRVDAACRPARGAHRAGARGSIAKSYRNYSDRVSEVILAWRYLCAILTTHSEREPYLSS